MKVKVTLPENNSDITLLQFQKYEKLTRKKGLTSREFTARVVSIFSNLDYHSLDGVKLTDYEDIVSQITTALNTEVKFKNRFYLDGVEIDSTSIQYISGSEIAFIDILKGPEANIFPNSGNGVIAMYSNDGIGSFSNVKRSPGIIDFKAKGFYVAKEFYAPDHIHGIEEQVNSDYRTTLHWEPEIRLLESDNMEVSFFTGDLKEEYIIEIEGITDSGIPVYSSSTFFVN